jgi:hypothetical protein
MTPKLGEYSRFSGLAARLARGVATRSLGNPSDGRGADLAIFPWHLDAFLPSTACEPMTIALTRLWHWKVPVPMKQRKSRKFLERLL